MKKGIFFIPLVLCFIACKNETVKREVAEVSIEKKLKKTEKSFLQKIDSIFNSNANFIAKEFDYPVGKPDAKGYYNAQPFGKNNHLGDDWNGLGGGNTDLGDPIYSIANGYVTFANDIEGGWGNVIRIVHKWKNTYIESIYAHTDTLIVKKGTLIKKGQKIATIGNANGIYFAHLHLEIRDSINMDIGPGYSENTKGYIDPTKFIDEN